MSGSQNIFSQSAWAYPTPLEPPDSANPFTLNPRVIEINGMPFQARSDCTYATDIYAWYDAVQIYNAYTPEQKKKHPDRNEPNVWRNIIRRDLWFFVYFVMKNPLANHPFIVNACKEIQEERHDSLEVWARDHLKTTIISVGRTCQKILIDPEKRIGIFSAVRPLAVKIQNLIKTLFESEFLVRSFPDILYKDPYKEAPKWTEAPEGGLIVKRVGFYKEATVSSWGLVEGMPIGDHYTDMIFDDIVTQDLTGADIMEKVCTNFDMAENIGTRDRQITVVGTFYRHDDPLTYIRDKKDPMTGLPMFKTRKKAATVDGSFDGASVFLPERSLARKRAGQLIIFYCQQLLDPTPRGREKLNRDHLIIVPHAEIPQELYKFMLIDGAGDKGKRADSRRSDAWALGVFGVVPYRDTLGLSDVYILDLCIEELDLAAAQLRAVDMYCRNGWIVKLGIEKVGMSSTEIHIASALRAKNKFVSVESNNLEILSPQGRQKHYRIEANVAMPLKNGKIHISDKVPRAARERLQLEMERFPAYHDDGLDILSYLYDMIKDYRFGDLPEAAKPESAYDRAFRLARESRNAQHGWMGTH